MVYNYGSNYIACKLTIILIRKLSCISFLVVFYLALQLVACDTGSFQSRLHEHVQSIAPSLICNVVIIPFACRNIEDYDAIWHHRVTIRLLVCPACSGPLYIVCACIMYRSLIPVWSLWVSAIHSFTLLFGFCFSRWLYNNRLTELPGGLLNATTQLVNL